MPKLWNQTIEAHRVQVREAILEAAAELVAEHGLLAVTMSQIADRTGIGRATLYKYFPDVRAILVAWHDDQVGRHIDHLASVRDRAADPAERLESVLAAYAHIAGHQSRRHVHEAGEIVAFLHRGDHLAPAQQRVHDLVSELLSEAARCGAVRDDVPAGELASYCLHAIGAAGTLPSDAAVRRLVTVVLTGLDPSGRTDAGRPPH